VSKKWLIDRRTFLKGAGASLALPLLDVMILNKSAFAQAQSPNLVFDFIPNGYYADPNNGYFPQHIANEIQALGNKVSFVTKISNVNRLESVVHRGPHYQNFLSFTRGFPFLQANPISINNTTFRPTFDQVIVSQLPAYQTSIPTFSLVMNRRRTGTPFYNETFSWEGPGKPVPSYINPQDAYGKLFGTNLGGNGNSDPNVNRKISSVLDIVKESITKLSGNVSTEDKFRLDRYFTSIRETERSLDSLTDSQVCATDDRLAENFTNFEDSTYLRRLGLMQDLMILAMNCGKTKIANIMRGYPATTLQQVWIPGFEGPSRSWHGLSHYDTIDYQGTGSNAAVNARDFQRINAWHAKNFTEFCQKMDGIVGPTGSSLLDNSLVIHGACQSEGPNHRFRDLTYALAGGAMGRIQTGQRIDTPHTAANLWLTIMKKFGVNIDKFGDSTGTVTQL